MRRRPSASTSDGEELDDHYTNSVSDLGAAQAHSRLRPDTPSLSSDRHTSNPTHSKHLLPPTHDLKPKRKQSRQADSSSNSSPSPPKPYATASSATIRHSADAKSLSLRPPSRSNTPKSPATIAEMARRARRRDPWSTSWLSLLTLLASALMLLILYRSFTFLQLDPKGGSMSYMASSFVRFDDFDTEHTRFATKYSLHMYRELGVDEDPRVKGVPVLFIPGNAGSYKQVRSLAAEAEYYFEGEIKSSSGALAGGKAGLDFFTVDFNEDFTAFHGQTLLDQAEYLNDAIAYILSLYHNTEKSRRDSSLPDPSSVILVGHSMGGIVARTMLIMPNYQTNSVNTIITLSAPHARPPVSFDSQMVQTYHNINEYWRKSHAKEWGMDNPLWHVTLISIAGGGLDTIVPSDYASLSSLVPETHGFTAFTSTIPHVWTGMDHLAITWCDEFRKAVIRALFDVMDVNRPAQTKPRGERMRIFKTWFLTGLEDIAEKTLPHREPKTLLTLEDKANSILAQGERLVVRGFGHQRDTRAYFLPIPPQGASSKRRFSLLTSSHIDRTGNSDRIEILFCSVFPLQAGHSASLFTMDLGLTGEPQRSGATRLACKNGAFDAVALPASTAHSKYPFDKVSSFSYLQYDLEILAEHQFVAVVEKSEVPTDDFLIAEFSLKSESEIVAKTSVTHLSSSPLHWTLPAERPLLTNIKVPALESSLFSYHIKLAPGNCGQSNTMFKPLLRQYISDVYESKFFVNVDEADINLHGVAPYMPPSMRSSGSEHGLAFQLWVDPTCKEPLGIVLSLDLVGSIGKLWMRYRTLFATFPLVLVSLVIAKQFKVYDSTGVFMSFAEGMNICLKREIPALIAFLIVSVTLLARSVRVEQQQNHWFDKYRGNGTETLSDYTMNNLLLGSPDPFFWFLVPIFGVICAGLCLAFNYTILLVTYLLTILLAPFISAPKVDESKKSHYSFAITSTRQRVVTTSVLLALVATVLPYQFAYLVLCIVQIVTTARAWRLQRDYKTDNLHNLYNYSHALLVLMIWILPINLPVLVVWVRNLAVQWLTPFSSHHNILSIVPYILLVETIATGSMVPRVRSRFRYVTTSTLLGLAFYAAVYGVSYAYCLHHVANIFCAWLVLIIWADQGLAFNNVLETGDAPKLIEDIKKQP